MKHRVRFITLLPALSEKPVSLFPEETKPEYDKRHGKQNKQKQNAEIVYYKHDSDRNEQKSLLNKRRECMHQKILYKVDVVRHAAHKLSSGSL